LPAVREYRIKQPTAVRGTCPQTDWRFREIFAFPFPIHPVKTDVRSDEFSWPDRGGLGLIADGCHK